MTRELEAWLLKVERAEVVEPGELLVLADRCDEEGETVLERALRWMGTACWSGWRSTEGWFFDEGEARYRKAGSGDEHLVRARRPLRWSDNLRAPRHAWFSPQGACGAWNLVEPDDGTGQPLWRRRGRRVKPWHRLPSCVFECMPQGSYQTISVQVYPSWRAAVQALGEALGLMQEVLEGKLR